jgi:hypothetical protein
VGDHRVEHLAVRARQVKRPELDGAEPALAPLIKPPTGLGRVLAGDAIVADLVAAGYVVKDKDGPRQRTIGEMLDLLIGRKSPRQRSPDMRDR